MAALLTMKLKEPTTIKKTLIWSANPHLQKVANNPAVRPLGGYLQESYKDKLVVIYIAADRYDTIPQFDFITPQEKAVPGSPEEWLSSYQRDFVFADLSRVSLKTMCLTEDNKSMATSYIDGIFYPKLRLTFLKTAITKFQKTNSIISFRIGSIQFVAIL